MKKIATSSNQEGKMRDALESRAPFVRVVFYVPHMKYMKNKSEYLLKEIG